MPLPTSNSGTLITAVGGIHVCRRLPNRLVRQLHCRPAGTYTAAHDKVSGGGKSARESSFMSSGSNKVKDGRLVVVPPLFFAVLKARRITTRTPCDAMPGPSHSGF